MTLFNLNKEEILAPQDWGFPVPIAYGPGRFSEIGNYCSENEITNPLIVTDSGSVDLPFIDNLVEILKKSKINSGIYSKISPNPRDDEIASGKKLFNDNNHDAIIAIGGGSAMDGGKSICLTANNEIELFDFEWEKTPQVIGPDNKFPKLITIPTTAGTGAETESTAMVTDTKQGIKLCIMHPELKPSLALLDPELTLGLPSNLTAWTGADAMIHSIEGYCVPGFHPLCDGAALESLNLISKSLITAVEEPNNLEARGAMLVASCLGGVSFIKGLGLVHAIAHMVGAEFNTHHGLTNAIILPAVLRYNLPDMEEKVMRMAQAMQYKDHTVNHFIESMEKILDRIKIPKGLNEIGVPEDCIERISEKSMIDTAFGTNPRSATLDDVRELVKVSIFGAR
jgi:alcohol dehydrogenase class IV